jgi:type IV secretory pathway VirB10-like protein
MRHRALGSLFAVLVFLAGSRADAVTIRDIIELSKAGLSDNVIIALIEVDRSVYSIDTATLKHLKSAGVSDAVIVAMIHSGRDRPVEPAAPMPQEPVPMPQEQPAIEPEAPPPPPQPVAVPYPVPVPVYVPVPVVTRGTARHETVVKTIQTDDGSLVRAQVPVPRNCVKAEPVYWGFGGKLRPDAWQPEPTIVCR